MFAAPPVIETRIVASLPEGLRSKPGVGAFSGTVARLLGSSFDSFLEGPSFDRRGRLYFVDVLNGRILRMESDGTCHAVVAYDGEPNGLRIHRDGRLFVADRRKGILAIDPETARIETIIDRVELEPFRGPNDFVFAANGDLYFTDQGMSDLANPTGRVFRMRANGKLEILLDALAGPNGIALGPGERMLYVALTRANCILRMPLPDPRPVRVQNFIQMSGGGGPDGIAADRDGGLAIAHPQMGAVWLFDAKGQPTLRIDLCRGLIGTNLAFGGADGRQLYITEAETGTIQVADVPVAGLSLYSHSRGT